MERQFERGEHVYKSSTFDEIIKDTIRFFNGTPVLDLAIEDRFHGTGVYAIYYIGNSERYKEIAEKNRTEFSLPIYVGKAVPRGWRQARLENESNKKTYELSGRLNEHTRSINQVSNLEIKDFTCRFMILEENTSSLIGTVEAALIRYYKPIWNAQLDGFGNHDPGKGRYNQAKSDWDVIHSGRPWADKCKGDSNSIDKIKENIVQYFSKN
ncbi:Eco29kI family restriction endonuclease [Candidatus Haliotispira prima]|uniref:Eco29kI family restriction endonuclease n=1 Tax=Candidatus Haliotispira prima TaxID=3034016 RepID=A0ABY8MGM0_9SPIO|nr:Eco29kI family restriction endonuclease [Candidatus Haliotispira prima]